LAHEIHEQIEHAGHAAQDGSHLPQFIGITIAILGVLMALCSAQVGEPRLSEEEKCGAQSDRRRGEKPRCQE
jgi:hypothetical protein